MRLAFAARAQLIYSLMSKIPGLPCPRPMGAFYLFPDVSAHFGKRSRAGRQLKTAMDFAEALLDESGVASVPGDDFGGTGPNHVRFSFACSESQIATGMERLGEFVAGLR
jgi:aspartate aminotransferase